MPAVARRAKTGPTRERRQRPRVFLFTLRASRTARWNITAMTDKPADPRELARSVTGDAFDALLDVLTHPEATMANRVSVALALWERGWGKPTQPDESETDERPVSELSMPELLARTAATLERANAILGRDNSGDRGPATGAEQPADVREHDRDSGSADPS